MRELLKKIVRLLPRPLKALGGSICGNIKISAARRAFNGCREKNEYLDPSEIARLVKHDTRSFPIIRYDAEGLKFRAEENVSFIKKRVPLTGIKDCLELGCWDGMVGAKLVNLGKNATGLDLKKEGFDPRAAATGVKFIQGDAASMPIPNTCMDLVYCFASFEHFADPAAVVADSWRVLRSGGYLYLSFCPVYTSPYGLHAYRAFPLPYCHYLFKEEDLKQYAMTHGLTLDWPYVNGFTVTQYRDLFAEYKDKFETCFYKEYPTGGIGAEWIRRHPSCFKGKVADFNDFFVSCIEVVLRKQ